MFLAQQSVKKSTAIVFSDKTVDFLENRAIKNFFWSTP